MKRLFGTDHELTAPVQRDCITCSLPLPRARLEAMPDAVQCVTCVALAGDDPPVRGRMIWSHKTAPELEIGTALAAQPAQMSYGPSIRLNSMARAGASALPNPIDWLPLERAVTGTPNLEAEAPVELVPARLTHPARCHPTRPRIGPSGMCLECAIAQQQARVTR